MLDFFAEKTFLNTCEIEKTYLSLHPQKGQVRDANAKIAQLVEHDLAKVGVAGSSPVFRSNRILKG